LPVTPQQWPSVMLKISISLVGDGGQKPSLERDSERRRFRKRNFKPGVAV
jgi:hypothetical protein